MASKWRVALGALMTVVAIGVAPASAGRTEFAGAFPFAGFDRTVDIALAGIAATTPLDGSPSSLALAPDGSLYFATGASLHRVNPDGWMTVVGGFRRYAPREVAIGRDGSLFVFDEESNQIVKLRGKAKTVVAGRSGDCSARADTNQAMEVPLCGVTALAVDSAGRLLIADTDEPARIRRLTADGTLETVAGGGTGDGTSGPATGARLEYPTDVATLPGGGFLVADDERHRVFEVGADDRIRVVAGGRKGPSGTARALRLSPVSVAPLSGGGFLVAADGRLIRVEANNRFSYLGGSGDAVATGLGGPLTRAGFAAYDVAVSRSGDVFVSTGSRVLLLPRVASQRPAAAFLAASVRSAHRYVVEFNSRIAGPGSVGVAGGAHHVKPLTVRAHRGVNLVRLPAALGSAAYTFRLELSHGNADVGDVQALLTGPGLTPKEAALLIDSDRSEVDTARVHEGVDTYSRGKCRAMGAARADCRIDLTPYLSSTYCEHTAAVMLAPTGRVRIRNYRGCKFALDPRWLGRAHDAPALTPY